MRNTFIQLCILILAITGIHFLKFMQSGFINGRIYPAGLRNTVVAISGDDSVKTVSENGSFGLMVKPGIWKVIVYSKDMPANVVRENLMVKERKNISLGEIRLSE